MLVQRNPRHPIEGRGACGESAKRPKEERSQSKTSLKFKLLGNCFLFTDSNFIWSVERPIERLSHSRRSDVILIKDPV